MAVVFMVDQAKLAQDVIIEIGKLGKALDSAVKAENPKQIVVQDHGKSADVKNKSPTTPTTSTTPKV